MGFSCLEKRSVHLCWSHPESWLWYGYDSCVATGNTADFGQCDVQKCGKTVLRHKDTCWVVLQDVEMFKPGYKTISQALESSQGIFQSTVQRWKNKTCADMDTHRKLTWAQTLKVVQQTGRGAFHSDNRSKDCLFFGTAPTRKWHQHNLSIWTTQDISIVNTPSPQILKTKLSFSSASCSLSVLAFAPFTACQLLHLQLRTSGHEENKHNGLGSLESIRLSFSHYTKLWLAWHGALIPTMGNQ